MDGDRQGGNFAFIKQPHMTSILKSRYHLLTVVIIVTSLNMKFMSKEVFILLLAVVYVVNLFQIDVRLIKRIRKNFVSV